MVNAIFRARFDEEPCRPDRIGSLSGSGARVRVPQHLWNDVPVIRRAWSGRGTIWIDADDSTAMTSLTSARARFQAFPFEINNKIKTFCPADKVFLTIFTEQLAANECCEPKR